MRTFHRIKTVREFYMVYDALSCVNYDTHERTLISRFKPLLLTEKGKGADDVDKECLKEILSD